MFLNLEITLKYIHINIVKLYCYKAFCVFVLPLVSVSRHLFQKKALLACITSHNKLFKIHRATAKAHRDSHICFQYATRQLLVKIVKN